MTTLLLIDRQDPHCVLLERGHARTRLLTHLHSRQLDRALALGASPDSSAALSLRAQTLIGAGYRARLVRFLRRLIEDAQRPLSRLDPSAPICRRKVLRSRQTLEELADRLSSGGPVDARGVAQLGLLLGDSDGPVYDHPAADDLEPALQEAMRALEIAASDAES
jgi:hypothetical protein